MGHHPADAKMETLLQETLRLLQAAVKTMHHATQPRVALEMHGQHVLALVRVQNDRQIALARQPELWKQQGLLGLARGATGAEVQSAFPHRHRAAALEPGRQPFQRHGSMLKPRVQAVGHADPRMTTGQTHQHRPVAGLGGHSQYRSHTRGARTGHDLTPGSRKSRIGQVAMAVVQAHRG